MEALRAYLKTFGTQADFANELDVTPAFISQWMSGLRPVPILQAVKIERVTHGAVHRWDLRPDDWHKIWPELIGAEGAPAVPHREAA